LIGKPPWLRAASSSGDREELLDQSARILLDARIDEAIAITDDDIPF